jgi:hypothetical protein
MKRLDKPTKRVAGKLLNIKQNMLALPKKPAETKPSKCLASKTLFSCLTVSYQTGGKIR